MKKLLLAALIFAAFWSCSKKEGFPVFEPTNKILSFLRKNMTEVDFSRLDQRSLTFFKDIVRIGFINEKDRHFILLKKDVYYEIVQAKIVDIRTLVAHKSSEGEIVYDGKITLKTLRGETLFETNVKDSHFEKTQSVVVSNNAVSTDNAPICNDCTLPEFVTTSSPAGSATWMSIYWIYEGITGYYTYTGGSGGGGGGGTGNPPPSDFIQVDFVLSVAEKGQINVQKYLDCFGSISNSLATYSISMSADLPVDDQPSYMFSTQTRSPGHAFLTLSKSNPYENVTQNIGFYPLAGYKSLSLSDVTSKVVDDANHEYQARYTVTLTAAQFGAILNRIAAIQNNRYNLATYNCTDFVLDVWHTLDPVFTVPEHYLPDPVFVFSPRAANTPQGLYDKIAQLQSAGTVGASANSSKAYTGSSHGPCN